MIDTQEQALAEARKRWLFGAWVRTCRIWDHEGTYVAHYVGSARYRRRKKEFGVGYSWDAAFADADKREGG